MFGDSFMRFVEIFVPIAVVLFLIYLIFLRTSPTEDNDTEEDELNL